MFLRGRLREMYRVVKQKAIAESFINCVSYNLFPIPRFQLLSLLSLPLCPLSLFSLSACHLFSVSLSASPSPFLYHFHFVFSLSEHACLPSYTIATRISTACRSSPIYLSFSPFLFLPAFLCHAFILLFSLSIYLSVRFSFFLSSSVMFLYFSLCLCRIYYSCLSISSFLAFLSPISAYCSISYLPSSHLPSTVKSICMCIYPPLSVAVSSPIEEYSRLPSFVFLRLHQLHDVGLLVRLSGYMLILLFPIAIYANRYPSSSTPQHPRLHPSPDRGPGVALSTVVLHINHVIRLRLGTQWLFQMEARTPPSPPPPHSPATTCHPNGCA